MICVHTDASYSKLDSFCLQTHKTLTCSPKANKITSGQDFQKLKKMNVTDVRDLIQDVLAVTVLLLLRSISFVLWTGTFA
jgi:hypothetical protein